MALSIFQIMNDFDDERTMEEEEAQEEEDNEDEVRALHRLTTNSKNAPDQIIIQL